MTQTHNTETLTQWLQAQKAPQPGIVDAYRAIEGAAERSKVAAQSVRYGYLLRQLPDFVLDGVTHAIDGDVPATLVLAYLTTRVGGVLHKGKNPVVVASQDKEKADANAAENAVISATGPRVLMDCAREKMRRGGMIEFDPGDDPFAKREAKVLKFTPLGESQHADLKAVMDKIVGSELLDSIEVKP